MARFIKLCAALGPGGSDVVRFSGACDIASNTCAGRRRLQARKKSGMRYYRATSRRTYCLDEYGGSQKRRRCDGSPLTDQTSKIKLQVDYEPELVSRMWVREDKRRVLKIPGIRPIRDHDNRRSHGLNFLGYTTSTSLPKASCP